MKTQTSPNDSKSKTKKTKNQLINDILSHTKTNFKIKSEPASEDESVRKNRNHNKSVNDLDKASLISKLLTLESEDLTKRKRRKSQTVDTSSDVILSMKIKTENESEYNQDSHTIKERSSFSENIRNSLSPVRVLQEKSDSALINKERENLEKLFSKPGNLVINTPEPLHNGRLSVQKVSDSHPYKTKTSFSSNLQDKKSEKTKHKSFPLPKTIIKSEQLNIDQDQQGISHNSLKNKNQTDRKHFDMDNASDEEIPAPQHKMIKTEGYITKRSKEMHIPEPTPVKLENSYSSSDSSFENDNPTISVKGFNESKSLPMNDSTSSSDEEPSVPRPMIVKKEPLKRDKLKNRTVPVPLPIKSDMGDSDDSGSENGIVPSNKGLNVSKSRFKNDSSSDDETSVPRPILVKKEPLKRDKLNNRTVPVPLPIKSDVADSDSGSENGIDPINKGPNVSKSRFQNDSSSDDETSVPRPILVKKEPLKRDKLNNRTVSLPLPIKSDVANSDSGSENDIDPINKDTIMKHERNSSQDSSDEEIIVPKPTKYKISENKRLSGRHSVLSSTKEDKARIISDFTPETKKSPNLTAHKGLNVSKSRFKNDSSSDDETSVPRPILVKKEPLKRDKLNNRTVPVPLPIKSDVADSDSGSENGIDPINKDTIMKHERNSSRDSSGEETTVPKPIKYKISENKRLSGRHSVLSSTKEAKSRTISDFTPGAKKSPNLTAHKGSKKSKMLSTNESTSDDEASVPKPKLIKTETPKRAKSKKKSIPVPLPIKTDKNDFDPSLDDDDNEPSIEKKTSFGDRSGSSLNIIERKVFEPKSVSKDNNSSSSSSETSEEENNRGKKTSMRREQHRVPDSSSDEDENIPVPKPVKDKSPEKNKNLPMSSRMEQNKATATSNSNHIVKWSIKAFAKENTSKAASSDDDSDSSNLPEVEAAVPNHQQGERRTSKTNETNMPVPVPKPIKSDNISDDSNSSLENERTTSSTIAIGNLLSKYGTPKNKSSEKNKPIARSLQVNSNNTSSKKMQIKQQHSDDTYIKKPETSSSIQTEVNEASEEENESDTGIPQPKKIKLEELMTAPRRQIESEDERTISESMAMQQFNSMSWIEKLKFRFPTIEKQTVKTKLPENAKYSLLLLPKNINPHSLVNLKCHLNKDTRVSFNDNEYVLEPLPNKPDPVLVSLNGPKLVPLQSVISLQKYVPKLNLTDPKIPEREDIALPSAIKSRHPLFGANYKQKLSLGKQVKRKLQEAIEHKKKMEEKLAKRRRKRRKNSLKTEESVLNIFDAITSTPRGDDKFMDLLPVKLEESATSLDNAKSKKKKKRNSYNSEQYVTQTLNETELLHKSKKRKREESLSLMDASEACHKKKKKTRGSKDFSEDNLDKPRKKRNHILEPE